MSRSSPQIDTDRPLGGRYKIVGQLGAGGFGQTFIAEDVHLPGHPRCVIKQLKPQSTNSKTLEMARRCFHTEAQVLYQLGIHEQIPRLLAHFEEGNEFYLAQEFIEGQPLTQELINGRLWSEGRTVRFLKDMLEILAFVHQKQVIHRDLKPSNLIRRTSDRRLVLIDFGAVKQASTLADPETGITDVTISIGTQGYMPSEQIAGKPRFSSDVYAVGILGIQALTGIHPRCLGEDERGEIAWWHRASHVQPELAEVLNCMVRYDFRDRYPTAVQALEALESLGIIEELDDPPAIDPVLPDTIMQVHNDSGGHAVVNDHNGSAEDYTNGADSSSTALWIPGSSDLVSQGNGHNLTSSVLVAETESLSSTPAVGASTLGTVAFRPERALRSRPLLTAVTAAAITVGLTVTLTHPEWLVQLVQPSGYPVARLGLGRVQDVAETTVDAIDPPEPEEIAIDLVRDADQLMNQQKYSEALNTYSDGIKAMSSLPEPHIGRCRALNALGRPEEAIVSCNDALAYRPGDAHALLHKGNAFVLQGRLIEALKLYEDSLYYDATIVESWAKRGATLQALGRSAEALYSIDQAIALHRDQPEAWSVRGFALWDLNRYEEAVVSMDKALQLNPDDQKVKNLREEARQLLGR